MKLAQAVPEIPVPDVEAAQAYFRDTLGFEIAWYNQAGEIGAVRSGDCVLFFRKTSGPIQTGTFWIFSEDVDGVYETLKQLSADIVTPIENTSWGLRQFTFKDTFGNTFHVHHDL